MDFHGLNLPLIVHYTAMIGLTILMVWVVISDTRDYLIPNNLNIAVLVLWIAACFFLPIQPISAICAGLIVLLVGLALFAIGFMGGGDVKLIVALTLWTGWGVPTWNFLGLTAVTGGILVLIVLPLRLLAQPILFRRDPMKKIPRILTRKQPVPYGIAIAAAFLLMLWYDGIPVLR